MDYGYNKLMKCFRRIVTVAILFGFFVRLSHGQTRPPPSEKVKVPICKSAYDTTSFSKPNIFNHTSQDEAILHMHTFQPLITTFCHHELIFFTCLVHIPWYHQESDTPGVLRSVCRSLCENIRTECQFAINKLNFHWPERISCEKFGNERNCVSKDPKRSPRPTGNQTCSAVLYNGGTPICSEIKTTEPPVGKYFVFVNNPFSNYFGHKTQEQALYELSRHAKLIHLLISQQPDINKTNEVTQCLNDITFLLCNLYLPKCGSKTPRDYPINSSQCRNVLGKNCNSAIQQLLNRGYNVTWPPVQVDCERFNTISTGAAPRFEKVRTFGGLSPPPPGVESKGISDNFLEIKWNSFPEEYKFGTTVETCILYKKSGSNVEYMHRHTNKNSHVLRGLNASTKYEIFVATVNSEALLPGVLEKIELQTVEGVEEIKLGYCSSLYNFTKLPNIFGHQTQDQAIRSIHKIGPLLNTACSSDLKALICSAYLPKYLPSDQAIQPPCKSLCERVIGKCKHAISQLRFKWPDELKCGNLKEQAPCYQPKPLPGPPDDKGCESVDEPSICSIINKPNTTTPYFATVSGPFKNHFNHTSQEQAAYELSKHAKLLSLLSTLIAVDHRNSLTHIQCVQRLTYFLCRLYFPRCNGGPEISRNDCKSIVETDRQKAGPLYRLVCLDSVERLQFQYRYNINWPPVRINCDSIDSSVVTPKVGYKDIRFQEILPPPADIVYQTIGQTVQLRKQRIRNSELTDPANAVKILYKQKDTEMAYLHNNHTSLPATLNIDTSKDYEFLVANMEPKNGMPGYFDRIMYTAGASVNNLPSICPTHELIVLPNKFGDNLSNARSRMIPLFPLVRTLCNSYLQTFLCSAVFPRYYFGRQDPCRSTCKKIFEDCSYAIARTKFLWPDEFKCDKFPNENCFDVTTTSRSILNEDDDGLPPPPLNPRGARSVRECKPTTVEICSRIRGDGPVSPFQSTFAGGQINYFKHTSTAQATFELSRHLRLLSVLQEFTRRQHRAATECLRYLPLFLCHVYVPSCPAKTQPQSLCTAVLGNGSVCFEAVKAFNQMDYDLKWPPVDVNCNDEKWFTPNGTLPSANFFPILPRPPPSNVEISRKTADEISVSFRSLDSSLVGLLYRQNNSETSYKSLEGGRDLLNIPKLSAATEYEIKVATMDRNGFPGIFRTITSRTFESSVIEIPRSMDICYNYYRNTALPNMYDDKTIESAKLKFYPFYPLVDTFCSSELETFLCSIFLPRYDPESLVSQKSCREACDRVYKSCKYAIARSRFHWPHELECSKFSNDATCYNLTKDETQEKKEPADEGSGFLPPQRRRRAISSGCKKTPSTPICSSIRRPAPKGGQLSGEEYFKTTLENGNYFNHRSTDEAVYEMSRYSNLLSSLAGSRLCFNQLTFLLCHLHLPACPQSPISQRNCLEFMSNKSSCFIPIKNLNDKGANFNWPPLKVNCQDRKWFSNLTSFDNFLLLGTNPFGPSAPVNIQINSRSSTKLGVSFQRNNVFNATALYRRNGSSTAYQFITQHGTENPAKLSLDQLTPATDYEIKIASLRQTSDLPGPFVDIQSNTLGQCQNDTTGDDVAQGTFFWTIQDANTSQVRQCPHGELPKQDSNGNNTFGVNKAQRFCKCDKMNVCKNPFWLDPDTIGCQYNNVSDSQLTLTLSGIFKKLNMDDISRQNASEQLLNITLFHAPEFTNDDVVLTTLILEDIVKATKQLNKTGPNIVKIIDNILNTAENVLLESQVGNNASARIVRVLEEYLESIPLQSGEEISQNEENIAVHTQLYDPKLFEGAGAASILEQATNNFEIYDSEYAILPNISQVSLTMPRTLFKNLDIDKKTQDQRISFVIYRKTSFFSTVKKNLPDPEAKTIRKKNSFVISGSVKGQQLSNLSDPIITTYQPLQSGIDETTACVFWNFTSISGKGDWSTAGCSYQGTLNGVVTCHCTHLTNFAILMDVNIDDRDETHDKALSIISYIGCAISLVGLILTIITILIFKDLRSKAPTQILLNFCVALSLTLIVFLAAAERSKTSSLTGCRVAAITLHYFVLAMFFWTSIQAYNMYLAFVKVMPSYHAKYILKCCVVGWGIPAIIVIITAAVEIEEYGDEYFCRLKGLAFQVAFLAPVVLILIVNSITFVLIFRSLLSSGSKVAADKRATGWQHARRGSAILVVLGLTWLFGVLAVRDAKLVFQYLFCIFNSIQGLLVFIFYCVLSRETRVKYNKLFCGGEESDTSHGKARYHGTSSEGRFHEINKNTKRDVYTTSTGGSSVTSTNKANMELTKF